MWKNDWAALEKHAENFDKSIKLLPKSHWTQAVLRWMITVVTFGLAYKWAKNYRFHVATTFGNYQFYPDEWGTRHVENTIYHESGHTRDCRRLALGFHPMVGLPLYAILYLLIPLPVGLALFRTWFELRAERYAIEQELGQLNRLQMIELLTSIVYKTSSNTYGWATPKFIGHWMVKQMVKKYDE